MTNLMQETCKKKETNAWAASFTLNCSQSLSFRKIERFALRVAFLDAVSIKYYKGEGDGLGVASLPLGTAYI